MSRHNRQNREQRALVEATSEATTPEVVQSSSVEPDDELSRHDDVHGWRITFVCAVCNAPHDLTRAHSTALREGERCVKCGSANFRESVEVV